MKQQKKQSPIAIPKIAFKHIKIECRRVSRVFHLNDDNSEELESHIKCEVRRAVALKYDPTRGKVYTFVQSVTANRLSKWMERETRRRNDNCSLAEMLSRHQLKRAMSCPSGVSDSVDDTSYSEEERWDRGVILPEAVPNGDTPWSAEGLARLVVIADVRRVVESLSKNSKRICKWYLKTGSLRRACEKMHFGSKKFFMDTWPRCRTEFIAKWNELESDSAVFGK